MKDRNFRPYRFMIEQKAMPTARPARLMKPVKKTPRRTKWRRKKTKRLYPRRKKISNRRNDNPERRDYFEESIEDEEIQHDHDLDDSRADGDASSNSGDIHIHLKSLLDTELMSYLMSEVPWGDFFAGNKLSRTEEVKYITESLIEEGDENEDHSKFGWNRESEKGTTWLDNDEHRRRYEDETNGELETSVDEGLDVEKQEAQDPSEVRKISQTHTVYHADCPYYFSRTFNKWNKYGVARTSLLGYMECEKEKNLGSNPFGGINFDSSKSDVGSATSDDNNGHNRRINNDSRTHWYDQGTDAEEDDTTAWQGYNVLRKSRRRKPEQQQQQSPVSERLNRYQNYVSNSRQRQTS